MPHNVAMAFFKDVSVSTVVAGCVAVLVGYTSSVAIVFQAAQAFNATPAQIASWMWALGWGMGVCTLVPSLWLKKPVMVSWSTPGAAVLASAGLAGAGGTAPGFTMEQAVGAFMVSAVLITLAGLTGWFERVMSRIPVAIASALLAGVLARFGLAGFAAAQTALPLVLTMLLAYLLGRRFWNRYAVPVTFLVAIIFIATEAINIPASGAFGPANPVFVMPEFTWAAFTTLALPLFIVTMVSQNMPGVATLQSCGYGDQRATGGDAGIPVSKVITFTGLASLVLAPFGGFALNFAAITAAICMGPQAHPEPARRYTAAVVCGAVYVVIGIFGAAVAAVLAAFPKELIAAIAALALLGTIGNALATALQDETQREAALITFLVTLSGVVLAGIGSAFWGVLAGALALGLQHLGRTRKTRPSTSADPSNPP
jgi:benzoate membrane transport protein